MGNKKSKKIVFIVGSGHSGSTILDMALGSSPNSFSLGEISQITGEIKKNTPCVCGARIRECSFWLGVNEIMKSDHSIDFMETPDLLKLEYDYTLTWPQKASRVLCLSRSEHFGINSRHLYDAIFEHSKAKILIDSSKDFKRALFLRPYLSGYRVAFIHLIRDIRGIVHSAKKKTYKVLFPGSTKAIVFPRNPKTSEEVLQNWIMGNLKISIFLVMSKIFIKSRVVRFEELTDKPFIVLSKLTSWLGLSNVNQMIKFGSVPHHNVKGNPSRFNSTEIIPSKKTWQQELNPEELVYIQKRAGLLNRIYGFRK